ncbi:MAG: hypothetical protein KGQ70_00400, partial [Alphaproteobacteria bacterium]|nr:hypothetical protein [Alphaproteobacteria bacterium]
MVKETTQKPLPGTFLLPRQRGGNSAFPSVPDGAAMFYVAISAVIMAFSSLFTIFPILVFLLLWFRHAFYKGVF